MIAPPCKDLKVIRYAEGYGYSAREWKKAFSAVNWSGGGAQPLKQGRKGSVWRAKLRVSGRELDCVLKVEPLGTVWKRLRALCLQTKAHRQWRGAERLARVGVSAAMPLAYLRSPGAEVLVLPWVEGPTLLEFLRDLAGRDPKGQVGREIGAERAVCASVAEMLGAMWWNDTHNDDGKPSNLVLDPSAEHGIRVLDTVAVRRQKFGLLGTLREVEHDLASLYIEPAGCGLTPRRSLCWRLLCAIGETDAFPARVRHGRDPRRLLRVIFRDTALRIRMHGDPTPQDDPLARPAQPGRS